MSIGSFSLALPYLFSYMQSILIGIPFYLSLFSYHICFAFLWLFLGFHLPSKKKKILNLIKFLTFFFCTIFLNGKHCPTPNKMMIYSSQKYQCLKKKRNYELLICFIFLLLSIFNVKQIFFLGRLLFSLI